ncbi:MAG: aminotransferase class V-fold PLP-dependent enzyme [Acidobacteriia bacterium]|nr:aminotransferase class V-fold PLP-dependent enzyme [Terriglobia bacterium]
MDPKLFEQSAARAVRYIETVAGRRVAPTAEEIAGLEALDVPLNDAPCDPCEVIAQLDDFGSPATVATTGPRYFGFVTGGSLPAAMAANWLAGAWDQNGALTIQSPVNAKLEEISAGWLTGLLGLPKDAGVGFVTGATMANFTALSAARHALLARAGWDVEDRGLFGAPEIKVIVGDEVHVSLTKALAMLGLGRSRVAKVPADDQGRMRADLLPPLDPMTLVCIQVGNVNTGAFDPAAEICAKAKRAGAWVHVDGAFGLWAAAAPDRAHLMSGFAAADSWATDCHKWLNVPYDSGLAFVRDAADLRAAMALSAAYLHMSDDREPCLYTPEASRRARGIEIWAALRSLGRSGLAEMIERHCRLAARFAEGLKRYEILNDVVLNQVLVSFGDAEKTRRVIREVQADGTCWCGGTEWHGKTAMRISVSCWSTTEADVDRSVDAIRRIANQYPD